MDTGISVGFETRRNISQGITNASGEQQGGGSNSPTFEEAPREWRSGLPHRHFVSENSTDTWERFNDAVEKHDENFCQELKDEISFLMVVAGLFLAIVTAFTIDSYKLLEQDKQDTVSELLGEVVRLLNGTSAQGQAKPLKPFVPDHHRLFVNQLWFLSMTLSLVAVVFGTFCLQWISAFLRGTDLHSKSASPEESLRMRQLRYHGMMFWGVRHAPGTLLLLVQVSITLFTCGLLYFLVLVIDTPAAAIPSLVVAGIAGALLFLANIAPLLQSLAGVFCSRTLIVPLCPYKSPTSWLVRNAGDIVAWALKPFKGWLEAQGSGMAKRFAGWLQNQPPPLTDYSWKKHDLMYAKLRESSDAGSGTRYSGIGVSSAIDILVLERDVMNIIRHSLKNLPTRFLTAAHWKNIFNQDLTHTEKEFLRPGRHWTTDPAFAPHGLPEGDVTGQRAYLEEIKIDFLHALALQNLVCRSAKLKRTWLLYRVELYIRIKNSSRFILNRPPPTRSPLIVGPIHEFGSSLTFPLEDPHDILQLDSELRFQLLSCVERLLDVCYHTKTQIMAAACIIHFEHQEIKNFSYTLRQNSSKVQGPTGNKEATASRPSHSHGENEALSDAQGEVQRRQYEDSLSQLCKRMKDKLLTISEFSDDTMQSILSGDKSPLECEDLLRGPRTNNRPSNEEKYHSQRAMTTGEIASRHGYKPLLLLSHNPARHGSHISSPRQPSTRGENWGLEVEY